MKKINDYIKRTDAEQYCSPDDSSHLVNNNRQRNRLAVTCILIMLSAVGMAIDESDYLCKNNISVIHYLEVYSAFVLLLAYIVPFVILMKWICAKYKISGMELLTAVLCGAFVPAAFAGELNGGFDNLMRSLMGHSYSDAWIGSAEAGIVEELLKLGTTAMLLYVLNRKSLKHYLTIGMCVGIGFQIEEDISYITESGFSNVNDAFPTALDRITGALGSHWAYAAVTAAGLYLIVRACSRNHIRRGLGWIVLVMADHFLYDSPIGNAALFNAIITAAVVLPVIIFFKSSEMTKEKIQQTHKSPEYMKETSSDTGRHLFL